MRGILTALDKFKAFDVGAGSLNLWTFRKSERAGSAPTYTGRWIDIAASLEAALKSTIVEDRARIDEIAAYDLLAQTNEASALTIATSATNAGLIVTAAKDEIDSRKARRLKDVQNTFFYSVKVVSGGQTLHAVARANQSWGTKPRSGLLPVVFSDEELELEESPAFTLSKRFDFFVLDQDLLISNKAMFESILSHRQTHVQDFTDMQSEPEFAALFSSTTELVKYVGTNRMHLRRASEIRRKGHYKDPSFMKALKSQHKLAGLTINFDTKNRIVPSAATCSDIFKALLDHRLMSRFSKLNYDVPSTTPA